MECLGVIKKNYLIRFKGNDKMWYYTECLYLLDPSKKHLNVDLMFDYNDYEEAEYSYGISVSIKGVDSWFSKDLPLKFFDLDNSLDLYNEFLEHYKKKDEKRLEEERKTKSDYLLFK